MRKFLRYDVDSLALVSNERYTNRRVLIDNFSSMGLGFISNTYFPVRSFITIKYQNETEKIVFMKSFIKHVRQLDNGQFFIGVLFVGIESKNDHAV